MRLPNAARILALSLFVPSLGLAQTPTPEPSPAPEARSEASSALFAALKAKEAEVEALRKQLSEATEDVSRSTLTSKLTRRVTELDDIRSRFEETVAGVDASAFRDKEKAPFSWEQTLGRVLEPILAEIENATATSRKIATLREEQETFSEKQKVAEEALANLGASQQAAEAPELSAAIGRLIESWEQRRLLAANQAEAARLRLQELEDKRTGYTDYARKFLSTRGLNLLYGVGAAVLVFFLVRMGFGLMRAGTKKRGLGSRLFSVLASILSVLGALAALLIVFSAAGDLFLVGIVLVFALGAGWAGIKILPEFVESLRLVLDIGMVREGERVVYDGIPWQVQQLGFTCRLTNPPLDGAVLRLPVKQLVGLHSRPFCPDELIFPTQRGGWVLLADGTQGTIVAQNPAHVVIEAPGGARKTYGTAAFLDLCPLDRSRASFRLLSRFGIDYAHQSIATEQVPQWFAAAVRAGLPAVLEGHEPLMVRVLFAEAGASSLDFEVAVDVPGAAAPLEKKIRYAIQRALVDCCTEHQLGIPFPQLTVHAAS